MLIFQPPVNFCSDENIQIIFGTKLEDFSNYRIDDNSISQTVEKVVKKIFFSPLDPTVFTPTTFVTQKGCRSEFQNAPIKSFTSKIAYDTRL
jgi:hypothetical protein